MAVIVVAAACSTDEGGTAGSTTTGSTAPAPTTTAPPVPTTAAPAPTTTAPPVPTLRILVTNDDGIGAEGIDLLVQALADLPDTDVTVVAPAENQSGSGDRRTDEPPAVSDSQTSSGHPGTAVAGTPADSVAWALGDGASGDRPHLVISGVNEGQNLGPVVALSGTVGAARTAARSGVPALAVSGGFVETGDDEGVVDYETAVELVLDWLADNRDAIVGSPSSVGAAIHVTNLNVPTCTEGEIRGVLEVPIAEPATDLDLFGVDCTSTVEDPADDVTAMNHGYAASTEIEIEALDAFIASLSG